MRNRIGSSTRQMFVWSLVFFGGKLGTVRLCEDGMKCEVKGKRRKGGH